MQREPQNLRALVLGGGGITGIAWETGLLFGLEARGIALREADLLVGTSAGSVVGAQIAGPAPLSDLYRAQVEGEAAERPEGFGLRALLQLSFLLSLGGDPVRARARLGRRAMAARPTGTERWLAAIEALLAARSWPDRSLRVTAVEAETGRFRVFDRDSGVPLVQAVAASCAVPFVFPPVPIGGSHFVDGGTRSLANVDLARGYGRVVVIAPFAVGLRKGTSPRAQAASLGSEVRSVVVAPDRTAYRRMGWNALDPGRSRASAGAGLAQAARVADEVARVWLG